MSLNNSNSVKRLEKMTYKVTQRKCLDKSQKGAYIYEVSRLNEELDKMIDDFKNSFNNCLKKASNVKILYEAENLSHIITDSILQVYDRLQRIHNNYLVRHEEWLKVTNTDILSLHNKENKPVIRLDDDSSEDELKILDVIKATQKLETPIGNGTCVMPLDTTKSKTSNNKKIDNTLEVVSTNSSNNNIIKNINEEKDLIVLNDPSNFNSRPIVHIEKLNNCKNIDLIDLGNESILTNVDIGSKSTVYNDNTSNCKNNNVKQHQSKSIHTVEQENTVLEFQNESVPMVEQEDHPLPVIETSKSINKDIYIVEKGHKSVPENDDIEKEIDPKEIDRIHELQTPPPKNTHQPQVLIDINDESSVPDVDQRKTVAKRRATKELFGSDSDDLNKPKSNVIQHSNDSDDEFRSNIRKRNEEIIKSDRKLQSSITIDVKSLSMNTLKKYERALKRSRRYLKKQKKSTKDKEFEKVLDLENLEKSKNTHHSSSKSQKDKNFEKALNLDNLENTKKRCRLVEELSSDSSSSKKKNLSKYKKFKTSLDNTSSDSDGNVYYSEDEQLVNKQRRLFESGDERETYYYSGSTDSEKKTMNNLLHDYSDSEKSDNNTYHNIENRKKKVKKVKVKKITSIHSASSESEVDEKKCNQKKNWKNDEILNFKLNKDKESDGSEDASEKSNSKKILEGKRKSQPLKYASSESNKPSSESDTSEPKKQSNYIPNKDALPEPNNTVPGSSNAVPGSSNAVPGPSNAVPEPSSASALLFDHREYGKNLKAKKPGRRNIREVIDDENTTETTRKAAKEENLRLQRLAERNNMFNTIIKEKRISRKTVVLDFDLKTKTELITMDKGLSNQLKSHQKQGVKFMWDSCYESLELAKTTEGGGCILAHSMGLGKSFQVVTLIHTLLTHPEIGVKTVLVICPTNTILNWVQEFHTWLDKAEKKYKCPIIHLTQAKSTADRLAKLDLWYTQGGVLIINYELFRALNTYAREKKNITLQEVKRIQSYLLNPGANLVVCDEGHLLKNESSALSNVMKYIRTKRKIVLTGTPLQNNLSEYHCMVSFVKPNHLGTKEEFLNRFNNPIVNGQFYNSNPKDVQLMKQRSHVLHRVLEGCVQRRDHTYLMKYLPPKLEYSVYINPSTLQMEMYKHFLRVRDRKKETGKCTSHFFNNYQQLKLILAHPCTMWFKAQAKKDKQHREVSERESRHSANEPEDNDYNKDCWWEKFIKREYTENYTLSYKLILLFGILERCEKEGDKLLVFSHGLHQLDLIEHFLQRLSTFGASSNLPNFKGKWIKNVDYFRLDGEVKPEQRNDNIQTFNDPNNKRTRLFLISAKAGGLGINLTGANRVVIFEPAWNPSHDTQSIFRVYRFGQTKPSYIYRFLAAGTIEHNIYNRAVTKISLAHRVLDEKQIERHYSSSELAELYNMDLLDENPEFILPKDPLLEDLFLEYKNKGYIYDCKEHETLFKDKVEEKLNQDEADEAWHDFHKLGNMTLKAKQKPRKHMIENSTNGNLTQKSTVNSGSNESQSE